ncbi:hypothetical protein LTR22_026774 [Elasticomyces elasticus]|nr:hypothetical protein LTR22_026774 [Elasticomyces elasticus]KAK4901918.1 hypothetical protein LTR49_027163 [Elasticomyces elasticus]
MERLSTAPKNEELDSSLSFANHYAPLHSQSATLLNNEFTDTPSYTLARALDSPLEEGPYAIRGMANSIRATFRTTRPPPSRAHTLLNEGSILAVVALKALQSVSIFIEQQPEGFLDYQESVAIKKIMEKIKRQSRADSIN